MAQRHAADEHLAVGRADVLHDDAVEAHERRLRAGVQAAAARRHHHALQEHAVVQPAALAQAAVDGEHQAHRRIEEVVVAAVLAVHAGLVGLVDAEQRRTGPSRPCAAARRRARPIRSGSRRTPPGAARSATGSSWTARIFADSAAFASPVSTVTFQGWVLVPDGAREATRRMSSTTSRGTGVGRKARTERRVAMAASTAAVSWGLGASVMGRLRRQRVQARDCSIDRRWCAASGASCPAPPCSVRRCTATVLSTCAAVAAGHRHRHRDAALRAARRRRAGRARPGRRS